MGVQLERGRELYRAAELGHTAVLAELLQYSWPERPGEFEPLHAAAAAGHLPVLRALLEQGLLLG